MKSFVNNGRINYIQAPQKILLFNYSDIQSISRLHLYFGTQNLKGNYRLFTTLLFCFIDLSYLSSVSVSFYHLLD